MTYYRTESRRAKAAYFRVKVVQIAVGAVIPVIAASGVTGWITASAAAIPVVAEGIQQLYQWHSNWLRFRSTAEALKTEKFLYAAQVGPYAGPSRQDVLAERITAILDKETADWAATASGEGELEAR